MFKKLLSTVLFMAFFVPAAALAQAGSIEGTVTDAETGDTVPGANVLLVEVNRGAATNAEGHYEISDIEPGTYTLRVTFIGYQAFTDQVVIERGENLQKDIQLTMSAVGLDELVVTGYGLTKRANLTSAVSKVAREEIEEAPVQSVDRLLQGKAAGVMISQDSGTPGGSVFLRVRGSTSITANNEPLYIVDGVPVNTGSGSAIDVGNQELNALSNISPSAIESIEILKGAAATAIYGTRGSNGVVLITTREGQAGDTQINVNYSHGFKQTINKYEMLNSEQHIKMYVDGIYADIDELAAAAEADKGEFFPTKNPYQNWEDYKTRYNTLVDFASNFTDKDTGLPLTAGQYFELPFLDAYGADPASAPTTDWQDAVFQTGITDNFNITASGGSEQTQYFISGSFYDEKGIMIESGYTKLNGRLNLNHQFNERASIEANMSYLRSISDRIGNDNFIYGLLTTATTAYPTSPIYNADGTYNKATGTFSNPVSESKSQIEATRTRFIGNIEADYEIMDNLVLNGSLGLDRYDLAEDVFYPSFTSQGGPAGSGVFAVSFNQTWVAEAGLNYSATFNEVHDLTALAYASYQETTFEQVEANGTGYPSDDLRTIESAATTTGYSEASTNGLASYIANANYIYDDRYIVKVTGRVDASSRFGENNRYAFFPSVGAAWRISNEGFMQDADWISNLKLRAGVGITGNQGFDNFGYQALYVGDSYSGATALIPDQIPNPDLRWEETTQYDLGVDVGFAEGRIRSTINVYYKDTKDLLLFRPIPSTTGFTGYNSNIGSVENKGIEFSLTTVNIQQKDLNWTTTLNISANRNKVKKLYQGQPLSFGFASRVAEGEPIGSFYGYVTNGIWNTQEEIDTYLAADPDHVVEARPGDVRFVDLDGDGAITSDDQQIIGKATPDFYGGLRSNLSYKGFELNAFFQFNYGGEIYNNSRGFTEAFGAAYASTTTALERWTPNNTGTNVYRASWEDANGNTRTSDLFIEDGSYLRLEALTIAYNFGPDVLDKAGLRSLRLYATGHNLFTLTNYSGLDPEVNTFSGENAALGTDFFTYPQARSLMVGINLGF